MERREFPSYLSSGYSIPWDTLSSIVPGGKVSSFLEKKLILVYRPRIGPEKRTKLWTTTRYPVPGNAEGALYVCVPRIWLYSLVQRQGLVRPPTILFPDKVHIECKFTGTLDNNQTVVLRHILRDHLSERNINVGTGAALLKLRAGLGKTFIAAALIAALQYRTLYVTLQKNLRKQAIGDMESVLDCKIGAYSRKKAARNDVDVVIINTARAFTPEIMAGYSLVIYDEVHAFSSAGHAQVFRNTMTWACIGMSATPDERDDGLDAVYHKELALRGLIDADNLPEFDATETMFYARIDVLYYHGPEEYTETKIHPSTGAVFTPWMQKDIAKDPFRTRLIVEKLRELYAERNADGTPTHGIYIFCEERAHLDVIYQMLSQIYADESSEKGGTAEWEVMVPEIGKYVGGIKDDEINRIVSKCRVYLTTYGYSRMGVSVCTMTAIILASPRKKGMTQVIGRIFRRNGDASICRRVYDIVDADTVFRNQLGSRLKAYKKRDGDVIDPNTGEPTGERYLTIVKTNVSWTEYQ